MSASITSIIRVPPSASEFALASGCDQDVSPAPRASQLARKGHSWRACSFVSYRPFDLSGDRAMIDDSRQ